MSRPLRLGVLISGGGRTALNLLDCIEAGTLSADVVCAISSKPTAAGVDRLAARGLEVACPPRDDHDAITHLLSDAGVELVCLCGYLRWLRIDPPFAGRVINIHPSLLPAFGGPGMYGDRVHAAVLESGATESGCTVHAVDGAYDSGPIILQRRCPVESDDDVATLAARVFDEECIAYPEAIRRIAAGSVASVTVAAP